MKSRWVAGVLVGAFSAGALTMYFADPDRGRRRRALLKDAFRHSAHDLRRFGRRFRRDLENKLEGIIAESQRVPDQNPVSDVVLLQRIRTSLGRAVSHPGAVEVSCTEGSVLLGGWVLADEVDDLTQAVRSVRGVKDLSTFLNTTDHPEHISALQSGNRHSMRLELWRDNWSPTLRVLTGSAGAGLILYGVIHGRSIGKAAAINGAILLARSILNSPLRRILGADPAVGIHTQKTITIRAKTADLYEFWRNPENYPQVFSHVYKVTRESHEVCRWVVMGPAGVPISWTGRITRQIPNKLVEWHSTPQSIVENHGTVLFESENDGQTRLHVRMSYCPPAGLLGDAVATLFGLDPKSVMDGDFVRLKSMFELGNPQTLPVSVCAAQGRKDHVHAP